MSFHNALASLLNFNDGTNNLGSASTLKAGANVTFSLSGDTVTIAASGGGGGTTYSTAANFGALPAANSVSANTIYAVLAGSGLWWINRKPAGFYISDGASTWTSMSAFPDSNSDANMNVYNASDNSKAVQFDCSGITTSTTRTLAIPNKNGTIACTSDVPATTDALTEGSTNLYLTNERIDDRVAALLVAGSNITLTYNDGANTLTVASTASGSSGYPPALAYGGALS